MIQELIKNAFQEDIPEGDLTTGCLGIQEKFGIAKVVAKQDLTLSGKNIFENSIQYVDPNLKITWHFKDSDEILLGQSLCQIEGNLINLIQAERVALNFLGYLSGIATQTHSYVQACTGTSTKILDTRKTLPLYRKLSKQAVLDGGGSNHRMNLSDGILIKENHIAISEDLKSCLNQVKKSSDQPIEVETKNLAEVKQAVAFGVTRIMLDNMNLELMSECLKAIPDNIETEASGNMTLERIPAVAALGVDFISVGAITHSVNNVDLSLLFDWN